MLASRSARPSLNTGPNESGRPQTRGRPENLQAPRSIALAEVVVEHALHEVGLAALVFFNLVEHVLEFLP